MRQVAAFFSLVVDPERLFLQMGRYRDQHKKIWGGN
jgi:hypothetical protein